jgi:hypothetical protein
MAVELKKLMQKPLVAVSVFFTVLAAREGARNRPHAH